ncbi:unnamed protein product, partial [Laminaria digitata]
LIYWAPNNILHAIIVSVIFCEGAIMPKDDIQTDQNSAINTGLRPDALPRHSTPPLQSSRPPRCPPF